MKNTGVQKWMISSRDCIKSYLPEVFTIEGNREELRNGFGSGLLNDSEPKPPRDGLTFPFFDSYYRSSRPHNVLESDKGFVVHVMQNPGNGSWCDAVYEVCPTDDPKKWTARLVAHNRCSREWSGRVHHNKFVLIELVGDSLEMVQMFLRYYDEGAHEERGKIKVFQNPYKGSNEYLNHILLNQRS